MALNTHIIYESSIDNRKVNCACGNSKCKIGLTYDTGASPSEFILFLIDKYGNSHAMMMNQETIKETKDMLQILSTELSLIENPPFMLKNIFLKKLKIKIIHILQRIKN